MYSENVPRTVRDSTRARIKKKASKKINKITGNFASPKKYSAEYHKQPRPLIFDYCLFFDFMLILSQVR